MEITIEMPQEIFEESSKGSRVGSGSGLSGPFSEVAVKMPMEYWLPFGLVLFFQYFVGFAIHDFLFCTLKLTEHVKYNIKKAIV